jgi:hypothetical protein
VHPVGYNGPVAYYELEGDGVDRSGYGFHGTPKGAPTYSAPACSIRLSALNGTTDYVELPALNLNSNNVTICAWVKRNGTQVNYAGIVFCRGGDTIAGLDLRTASDLGYHWNNATNTYSWSSGLIVPDDQWVFAALVLQPPQATIHMGVNGVVTSGTNAVSHSIEEFNGATLIGRDSNQSRYFKGMIDAVRIYNRALSEAEIGILAKLNQPGDADVTGDGDVNNEDVAAMAAQWLWGGEPGHVAEDIVKDGSVDHIDFAQLANLWLE